MASPVSAVKDQVSKIPGYVVMGIGMAVGGMIVAAAWAFYKSKTAKVAA